MELLKKDALYLAVTTNPVNMVFIIGVSTNETDVIKNQIRGAVFASLPKHFKCFFFS